MKSKKPGIGSWISFEDGLLEYKESELRKEWWYYVTEDNPYVTRNERRRNKKPSPVQVVAPPPKPTTPRVIPIKPVQKAASPDKEVRPQPPNELEPIVKEAPKKTTVKKEKKEKVTKTTPETEPLKELEPVQEPEPVPEPVQKPKIVPKSIQEPEPVKELVPELVQEQEPVKELDAELYHINPRFSCEFDPTTTITISMKPRFGLVKEPIEGSAVSIYCDNKANPEALRAVLDQPGIHELPLVVIPVAGEYRGGKSFLLSYFIRYLTNQNFGDGKEELVGFKHKQSKQSVTQGIEIWSQPLIVNGSEGQKFVVLLMDCQGILGGKDDKKQASRVFALSTMLSSIMVFNLSRQINSAVLSYLHMFTSSGNVATTENDKDFNAENAKEAGAENGKKANDETAIEASVENAPEIPFQKLMILIRDWQNSCNFGSEEGKQYLDDYFKENGNVFDCYFNDICCYCMPHPGKGITKPGANGCLDSLDTDFQQYMKDLITDLCSPDHLAQHVKKVAGSPLTAGRFCDYFKICANGIMKEDMNHSINVVEMEAELSCTKAKQEALGVYTSFMKGKIEVKYISLEQLDKFDEAAKKKGTEKYEENSKYARRNAYRIFTAYLDILENELNETHLAYQKDLKRRIQLQKSIDAMKRAIRDFQKIDQGLIDIIDAMSKFQTGVRKTKWTSAVIGVTSLCLLPTPLAAVGIGGLTASGALGAVTVIVDFAKSKEVRAQIVEYALHAKEALEEVWVLLENVRQIGALAGGGGSVMGSVGGALLNLADDGIAAAGTGMSAMKGVAGVLAIVGPLFAVLDAVISQLQEKTTITGARNMRGSIIVSIKDLNTEVVELESML